MEDNNQNTEKNAASNSKEGVSFLKVDALKRGSYALSLFLKTNDIIVGVDKKIFRGTQKVLNETLKEKQKTILTIYRKSSFFNVLATGPLGIQLLETGSDEDSQILEKVRNYLDSINNFDSYREYEVFRGKGHRYNVIEVNEGSLFASLFPLIWFFHYKLYLPLFLIIILFVLLGTIEWWLFLASWVILTIYMSKGSMSMLRGYCMFNEMRMFSKIYAETSKDVQLIIREQDKKSNFNFSEIPAPELEDDKQVKDEKESDLSPQAS